MCWNTKYRIVHSFIHLFIHSFIHSFVLSFIRSFVHSFNSFIHVAQPKELPHMRFSRGQNGKKIITGNGFPRIREKGSKKNMVGGLAKFSIPPTKDLQGIAQILSPPSPGLSLFSLAPATHPGPLAPATHPGPLAPATRPGPPSTSYSPRPP